MSAQASGGSRCLALRIAALCAALAFCPRAFALNPKLDVTQYAHTAWTNRDGVVKGMPYAITQTADGFIWLGTDLGLLRFDGVRAVPWQAPPDQHLPSDRIGSLLAARDGALWIGTIKGLGRWRGGKLRVYPELDGMFVLALLEDHERTVWAGGYAYGRPGRLCAFRDDRVNCWGEDGAVAGGVLGLHEDREGTLWAGGLKGFWRWRPGPSRFFPIPGQSDIVQEPNGIEHFAEDSDGTLLIPLKGRVARFIDGSLKTAYPYPQSAEQVHAENILRDRDGGVWVGTEGRGLVHIHQGGTDIFSESEGLSGNYVSALFEDREGNVWVGTNRGLDRFRAYTVASFGMREGFSFGMSLTVAARDGSLWWLSADGHLNRWDPGPGGDERVRDLRIVGLPKLDRALLFEDNDRRMWVAATGGVGYLQGDRFVPVDAPAGPVFAMAGDAKGNLWISNFDRGLLHLFRGKLVEEIPWDRFGRQDLATALIADRSESGVWLGFSRGGVAFLSDGRIRASYTAADGLGEGRISDLRWDHDGTLWAATDNGISRLKDGRVATLSMKHGLPCDRVGWLVEAEDRALWLYAACGLVRIVRPEIDDWAANGTARQRAIHPILLDDHDGVAPLAEQGSTPGMLPSISPDGTIWFVTADGLCTINPRDYRPNTLPVPVRIEQLTSDGKAFDAEQEPRLSPRVHDLTIAYTALSFVAPERVLFRYKLEGFDQEWQDAGSRRQAYYTNLPPGNYRFRVLARNDSGVWNTADTAVAFAIAPAYYQTIWFAMLSVTTAMIAVWSAYRLRLRNVETHQQEIGALNERLMKTQEQERIYLAGELHDGVMQEMLAVTMLVGTARRRIPAESDARATLDRIEEKMIRVGTDIRRLSHDLHPPLLQEAGLPGPVRAYCDEFSTASGIPVSCEVEDSTRELSRGAALALFRIVQEALGNAAKHAKATRISVRVARANDSVSLMVSDNGVGFDRNRPGSGGLGLITMRERASQLNGEFEVESAPGRGTAISVSIPFR